MTVPPLTERLDAAINAVYTADEGTSSYQLDNDTRALLREAKAALEQAKHDDPDYSPVYQDEYQRAWHEAAKRAEAAEARVAALTEALDYCARSEHWQPVHSPPLGLTFPKPWEIARDALAGKDGGER